MKWLLMVVPIMFVGHRCFEHAQHITPDAAMLIGVLWFVWSVLWAALVGCGIVAGDRS